MASSSTSKAQRKLAERAAQIVREDALKFAGEVLQIDGLHTTPPQPKADEVTDPAAPPQTKTEPVIDPATRQSSSFLEAARFRFFGDTTNTYFKLLRILGSANPRSEMYTKVSVLLIGHADLLRLFEEILINGREENRREIVCLRVWVRDNVLGGIRGEMKNYESANNQLTTVLFSGRGELTDLQANYIAKAYVDGWHAPTKPSATEIMENPGKHFEAIAHFQKKDSKLQKLLTLVSDYFDSYFLSS